MKKNQWKILEMKNIHLNKNYHWKFLNIGSLKKSKITEYEELKW